MDCASLRALSHDDLITVILAQAEVIAQQAAQNAALTATNALLEKRVAELEEKLGKPPKTPNNSSLPPSTGQKPNLPARERKGRKGRPGVNRALAADPDHVIEALAQQCLSCAAALGEGDQPKVHAYDHIDMPPIKPVTTRINLHSGVCPCCAATFTAPCRRGWSRARRSVPVSRRWSFTFTSPRQSALSVCVK